MMDFSGATTAAAGSVESFPIREIRAPSIEEGPEAYVKHFIGLIRHARHSMALIPHDDPIDISEMAPGVDDFRRAIWNKMRIVYCYYNGRVAAIRTQRDRSIAQCGEERYWWGSAGRLAKRTAIKSVAKVRICLTKTQRDGQICRMEDALEKFERGWALFQCEENGLLL
ncbi:hypothetical protein BGZ63DRAFT_452034 [Mariannaea sp. PMI_226]|nr:hypothetical protein BGZ63DRAFT_452034 [Mariannaea sp. PMI_226]